MSFICPSPPRQRLYTNPTSYSCLFSDLVLGKTETGNDREVLETSFAERLGLPTAIAVNQARVAVYLAVKLSVRDNRRKVLLSPFTIFDVVNMVLCAGGEPEFIDVVPGSYTINKDRVKEKLGSEIAAVLITHSHQMCASLLEIQDACREAEIPLIEDCAVALGTSFENQAIGTFGDFGIFSFGLYKNVCGFYGGMLVLKDDDLGQKVRDEIERFERVRARTLLGRGLRGLATDILTSSVLFKTMTFWIFRSGLLHDLEFINRWTHNDPNPYRTSELPRRYQVGMSQTQARIIGAGIERVESDLQERLSLASYYWEHLREHTELTLPDEPCDLSGAYHTFPIQLSRAKKLHHFLAKNGRDCSQYYYRNCASLDCFKAHHRSCPEADRASRNILLLPTYPGYGLGEAARNVKVIRRFFDEFPTS